MEEWRRAPGERVSAFPVEKAGPAHIATLKTFDPPLSALEGRRFAGAERRAKRLLFPTEDGELVLVIHLMSAGRVRYLLAGEKRPKSPALRLPCPGGGGRGAKDARGYRVHKKLGEPCHVCGTPIARVDFEEHTIYYCPECQTGGRVLKDRRLSRLLR